jgi:hypothetical protein
MYKCTILALLLTIWLQVGVAEVHIPEANLVELHQDTFYKFVHNIEKAVIVELYTSDSWCSKFRILLNSQMTQEFH